MTETAETFCENMEEVRTRLNRMSDCLERLDPELQKLGFDPVRTMGVTQKLRVANLVTAIIDAFSLQGELPAEETKS